MTQLVRKWNFQPHPLVKNGHLQSIVGIHWPTGAPPYQAKQHVVALDDGDQIVLHEDAPADLAENAPMVLLVHGLGGCHLSSYMCRMADKLTQRGYRAIRMDMRGCGAGESIARKPAHCGLTNDFASSLHYLAEIYPDAEVSLVGFSMSGTVTLNMLAEAGEMRVGNLQRSMAINSPIDLAHVESYFNSFWGSKYNRFFVKLIWSQLLRRWDQFSDIAPSPIPKRPKRLRDIDEAVVAPAGGYTSAADYYEKASPVCKLQSIKQPVTIVFAEDDPVVPIGPLLEAPRSSSVEVVTTKHGGHLGFLASRSEDPDFRWLDWRILDWLQEGCPSASPNNSEAGQEVQVYSARIPRDSRFAVESQR
ncbi:MAG: alpha/beta fold hydrolase [Planctomycetota bacterium]